jgi:hypothetical protein
MPQSRAMKNHSAKAALRVIQRAINHPQWACLTNRLGVVFIVSTAHNSARPTFER